MIVRLVMLALLFMYGTGFWLYPILALFVPFQDKKSSSGSLGNIFFELLRIIIWGAIIVMIGSIILGSGVAFIFGISIPPIGNQSVLMSIPTHLYVLAGLSAIALITLFGAAVSALFKKYWLPK